MSYTVSEPFSVGVEIRTGTAESLRWTVSRDLLDVGTSKPQGMGAHRIWPSRRYLLSCRRLYLGLGGPRTPFTLEMDHCQVRAWLDATYELVPRGSEPELLDWEALARELLQRRD
ncbi:SsgA family sporulation/cell division regulator [Streptomyces sp. VRA16 Mangrove soil]|uniref:SsgA family sporulation/cell division regulator n=1 Tax=Streptomyces sp. VRA16 Mangrove soil TaxID=2817434 RepID=UPI001E47BC04|nr:SsgA family sporulation/cell division regulator [Streptomyces sp. VRA16 Mangrove soil]